MHMLSNTDQRAFLQRVYEHLADTGHFMVSLFFPHTKYLQTSAEEEAWFTYQDDEGRTIRVSGYQAYYELRQVVTETAIRRVTSADGSERIMKAPFSKRYTFPQEMEMLLDTNGFTVEERFGGPDRSDLTDESQYMVYVCAKKTLRRRFRMIHDVGDRDWVKAFYNSAAEWWGESWYDGENLPYRLARVERFVGPAPKNLLELGAWTGESAAFLAAAGYQVTALDISEKNYALLWRIAEKYPGVTAILGDYFTASILENSMQCACLRTLAWEPNRSSAVCCGASPPNGSRQAES